MFSHKGKTITFQDMAMKSESIMPSSEDFKDVTKLMPQKNQNTISEKQKELEEVISNKNKQTKNSFKGMLKNY